MSFVERCRQRHLGSEGGDEGFTLIELLVVLLIIGILLAIAIPTFLSVTKGANNTAAQSNLQNALTGAKTYFTDSNQSYVGLEGTTGGKPLGNTSDISQIGTGLTWVSGNGTSKQPSTGPGIISADVAGTPAGSALILVAWSNGTNDCWVVVDNTAQQPGAIGATPTTDEAPGTYFGVVTGLSSSASCVASSAAPKTMQTTGFPTA